MKLILRALGFVMLSSLGVYSNAQCVTTSLNWDYLDFLDPSFPQNTLVLCQNQRFAFGTQSVTITNSYSGANIVGENSTITGKTGTYGSAGDDVQFTGDGNITVTFQNAVSNVKFSVYDIDYNQKVTVIAMNGLSPGNVTMAKVSGTSLTIFGSGSTTAAATANSSLVSTSSTSGAINVDISGPVTSFTIAISNTGTDCNKQNKCNEDGSFWLSDIEACSLGAFPNNYHSVSKPWAGMPSYVLAVNDNKVYYIDPVSGKSNFIFEDAGTSNINSLAYDPINKFIYYTYSLTSSPSTDLVLRRYDYNMDTLGIVSNNIGSLGFPIYENGVESGGASFYDGSLYLGIEGNGTNATDARESKIYKIDFNASHVPIAASQVYGISSTGHDWGDFGVVNGTLYDFDAKDGSANLYVVPLIGRNVLSPVGAAVPKQTAIDWQGNLYSLGNNGASPNIGVVASYSTAGVQGTIVPLTINGSTIGGSWGDAAEAFKPKLDFGDAPASYDPDPLTPAMHERAPNLRLGAGINLEWDKTSSVDASADIYEDGLPFVQILNQSGNYYTDVDVYNNTGADATVCAWIDFNGNGVFETGEGTSQTVPAGSTTQRIQLLWNGIFTPLPNNSFTFLRIRITSAANSMTTSNPTGYFANGEVEDYHLIVSYTALDMHLKSFSATKLSEQKVNLKWEIENDEAGTEYELQRSSDGKTWQAFYNKIASDNKAFSEYAFEDFMPFKPISYYRLKYTDKGGKLSYTKAVSIQFGLVLSSLLYPNPAAAYTHLKVEALTDGLAQLQITDINGKRVYKQSLSVSKGTNTIALPIIKKLQNGTYVLSLTCGDNSFIQKLIVRSN